MKLIMHEDGRTGIFTMQGYEVPVVIAEADLEQQDEWIDISAIGTAPTRVRGRTQVVVTVTFRSCGELTRVRPDVPVDDPFPKRIIESL